MENLGVSPLPDGMVRLFSECETRDLAYVGGTSTKYVPIGDRVEVNVLNTNYPPGENALYWTVSGSSKR
jgi:hypothetical protein